MRMWLKSLQLRNVKSFADSGLIRFSPQINLLVGPNNAGKSVVLRAASLLQPMPNNPDAIAFLGAHFRRGTATSEIEIEMTNPNKRQLRIPDQWTIPGDWTPKFKFAKHQTGGFTNEILGPNGQTQRSVGNLQSAFHQSQPNNFLYTYFSRRKPNSLNPTINLTNAQAIEETFQNLPSKVDRLLGSRDGPLFNEVIEKTLGFRISCNPSPEGKQIGLLLGDDSLIPVMNMGEGIINLLAFLVHLATAYGQLFLIEEIENDLHPTALKYLLEFIIKKSENNQFIISTHSNIVVRHLGAESASNLFSVQMELAADTRMPTSTCEPIKNNAEEKIQLLEGLGYEPYDFGFSKGYLILEESTAEKIIRDFLIPFLVPALHGKLKTIASNGVGDVETRLSNLLKLFVFLHTTPQYDEKAWVAVDGGPNGAKLVDRLKEKFKTWPGDHFCCFREENFEKYYPSRFQESAQEVLGMRHGRDKQAEKGALVQKVISWAMTDVERAKREFKECAKEILDFLEGLAAKLG